MIGPELAKVEVNGDLHSIPEDWFFVCFPLPKHKTGPGTVILHLWYVKDKNADPDL